MCHFITMVAPRGVDEEALKAILRRYQRGFMPIQNRFVQRYLKSGELYFLPSPKYCDCGTSLGSARDDGMPESEQIARHEQEIAKLRRKGWSNTKIERWERDQAKASERRRPTMCEDGPDEWPSLLEAALEELRLPYIGILLHMYSGGFDTAPKDIERRRLRFDEDLSRRLYEMKEDVLYVVEAR